MEVNIGPNAMQAGMRRLASGVCVLSAAEGESREAMTVSSVTSVSDSPASLLVCVHRDTPMFQLLSSREQGFVINVLARKQQSVSNRCAGQSEGEQRFAEGDWQTLDAQPYLADAEAAFFCHVDEMIDYASHRIVIGQIKQVAVSSEALDPLLYADGAYQGMEIEA